MMRRILVAATMLFVFAVGSLTAQETYFGKNKVRYKGFDWKYIQTRHFDVYFYEDAYASAKFGAEVMEAAYVEISRELNYKLQKRIPVFIYNSHNDFQQTNIISNILPEGVGGFTEAAKNRIAVPFDGSYEDFRHTLHHELTHAMTYDLLYGNMFSSLLSRQRLFNMPLWLAEGYAEYSSRHGWDYWSDMYVRDMTINNYLIPPAYASGYLAYRQGQAMIKYIADKYGEDKIGELFKKGKMLLTMNKTLKATIGLSEEEFWKEFSKEMKRRYWPEIAVRKDVDEIAKQLTHSREDGSYFNEQPEFSPDGDRLAIFSDISDFTEIIMISAVDGKKIKSLVKSQRSGDLESLHAYVSGMSFSPDGRNIVFVAKSKGKEALFFYDIARGKVYEKKRFDYYNIVSPRWSPDGKKVAFSALESHKRDLFVYHIEQDFVEQVTDDRFDDVDPDWLPDSKQLVFVSDRPHPMDPVVDLKTHPYADENVYKPADFGYGDYNLFRIELANLNIKPIDVGPGENVSPKVSPDGTKLAFVSNRNGIDNIYIAYLDSAKYYAVTDILTGVRNVSWSPSGKRLAFSAMRKGAYDVFILKDLVPAGDNGVLAATDYVLGKYDREYPTRAEEIAAVVLSDSTAADSAQGTGAPSPQPVQPEYQTYAVTDSMLATMPDSVETEPQPVDSTQSDSTVVAGEEAQEDTTIVTETGTYDDEYVFVSEPVTGDPLDSLMLDIPDDTTYYGAMTPAEEPPSFDSIPDRLPSGEYEIHDYTVKFTPDFMGGGFLYDTFFGLRGQSYFVFSDYLGNHQIYVATDLVNTIDQSIIQAYYFNNEHRQRFGAGLFHSKNYYADNQDYIFSDRFYGVQMFASRPFSTFSRLELGLSQYFIDRKFHTVDDPRENNSTKVTSASLSHVADNILWGYTGPLNGRRSKITLEAAVNLFDADDLEYYALSFDYRKYWHFKNTFSMAFRVSGAVSEGTTPKRYYLGGTTNWIGTRTLADDIYEVRNLYFADVVTPLRGVPYYEIAGDRYALMNWEFRFPMVQYFVMSFPLRLIITNVTGVVFYDMGAAWYGDNFRGGSTANGVERLQDIKTGFGFGWRANLFGFILLRYDLAWSTNWNTVSDRPKYYFSFGADF